MKSQIILILIFFGQNLSSQVINKLQFNNYQPLWSYYSGADSLSTNIQGIFPTHYPICTDNELYIVSNIFDKTTNNGHITEKIDLLNGNRLWSRYQYSTVINTREYAQSPYLENGQLGIHIYKESRTPNVAGGILWSRAVLKKTEYDASSGITNHSFMADSLDTLNKFLNIPESIINNVKTYIFKEQENTGYIKNVPNTNGILFTKLTLDNQAHKIDSISIELPIFINLTSFQTRPLQDDKYMYQMTGTTINGTQTCRILIIDKNLRVIQNQEIINLLPENYDDHILNSISKDGFYITSIKNLNITLSKFDLNFELIGSYNLGEVPLNIGVVKLKDNSSIISYAKNLNGIYKLFIFRSISNGDLRLIKELDCIKSQDEIFVRTLYLSPKSDLLMNLTHIDNSLGINPLPRYSNWTLFSGVDLGITTETIDQSKDLEFSIIPNPSNSQIQISSDNPFDQVNIYTSMGQKIMTAINNKSIDVSNLQNGLYIAEILNNNVSLSRIKFIKV